MKENKEYSLSMMMKILQNSSDYISTKNVSKQNWSMTASRH